MISVVGIYAMEASQKMSSIGILDSETKVPPPKAEVFGIEDGESQRLEQLCRVHLDRLVRVVAVPFACICYDFLGQRRQFINCASGFEPPVWLGRYLIEESWLKDAYPLGKVRSLGSIERGFALAFLFERSIDCNEYVLVYSDEPFSNVQRSDFEERSRLFETYLELKRESARLHMAVESLEESILRLGHQLRQPLAVANLFAENLRLSLNAAHQRDYAQVVCESLIQLEELCTKLLESGRPESMCFVECDLGSLIARALKNLEPLYMSKQLQILCPQTAAVVCVDPFQMEQVFENILQNAIDISPFGETIEVRWRVFLEEVLIDILDRGPGLSEEDLRCMFTPYYSRRPNGTGLGLAIARKIVHEHRGRIWASNRSGVGALFSMVLPLATSTKQK
jgi:signal transduction histidine kinase